MSLLQSLLVIALVVLASSNTLAQHRWEKWYFGVNAGIDFTSGSPVVIRGLTSTIEGTASISDPASGKLLFYTDGVTVWNRDHTAMPNGTELLGHPSATQSALIVPDPGNTTRYYLFTVDAHQDMAPGYSYDGVNYSIVDMTLDNGRGDITLKNERIDPVRATEKLCGVRRCSDGTYWVIVHEADTRRFFAYHIDSSGIAPPVTSSAGSLNRTISALTHRASDLNGHLKASTDGSRLVLVQGSAPVEVFDFDLASGNIALALSIPDTILEFYGVSFSPDGSRLYALQMKYPSLLVQYDLTAGSPFQIAQSRLILASYEANGGAIQIGPDGRIYITANNQTALDVVAEPNASGRACDFRRRALDLRGTRSSLGLPNIIDSELGFVSSGHAGTDQSICPGDSVRIDATGGIRYRWSPASTLSCIECPAPMAKPAATTSYIVEIMNASGCSSRDTVVVEVHSQASVAARSSGEICIGDTTTLSASGGVAWEWAPSTGLSCTDCASPRANPNQTTLYTVTSWSASGCVASDTVSAIVHSYPIVSATGGATVCENVPVQLNASGADSYRWYPSDGLSCTDCANPIATRAQSIVYYVVGTNASGCSARDSVAIAIATTAEIAMWGADVTVAGVGKRVAMPLRISDRDLVARETSLELDVTYDADILRFSGLIVDGSILEGGTITTIAESPGRYTARLMPGAISGSDTLLSLIFRAYIGDRVMGNVDVALRVSSACITTRSTGGSIVIDSICGLDQRLIELMKPLSVSAQPNPFTESTNVEYTVTKASHVRMRVFDAGGNEVHRPVDRWIDAGTYTVSLDGAEVPTGTLLLQLESDGALVATRLLRR